MIEITCQNKRINLYTLVVWSLFVYFDDDNDNYIINNNDDDNNGDVDDDNDDNNKNNNDGDDDDKFKGFAGRSFNLLWEANLRFLIIYKLFLINFRVLERSVPIINLMIRTV
jgi:hypothetical protein